jgi:membrane AbrB-like protein
VILELALTLTSAIIGAFIAVKLRLPGGMIIGATFTTAFMALAIEASPLPMPVLVVLFVKVGVLLGLLVNRRSVQVLRTMLVPAFVINIAMIAMGWVAVVLLRWWGVAPIGDILATAPGAMTVLSPAAAALDLDAPTVAFFHLVRVILTLLSIPLLLRFLPKETRTTASTVTSVAAPAAPPASVALRWILVVAGSLVGAGLAEWSGMGGGVIFGATIGTAVVMLMLPNPVRAPNWLAPSVQIGTGWMIGSLVTPESVALIPRSVLPALFASIFLIAFGIASAFLMRLVGVRMRGDILATSPGAPEVFAVVAAEHDADAIQVAAFQTLRILLVVASLPILLQLMPG